MFRSGRRSEKPDALTRRTRDLPVEAIDDREQYRNRVPLESNQLNDELLRNRALALIKTQDIRNSESSENSDLIEEDAAANDAEIEN